MKVRADLCYALDDTAPTLLRIALLRAEGPSSPSASGCFWPKAADQTVSAGSAKKSASAPKVGRPKEFDREVALPAAMRTFWTQGYEGT